MPNVGVLVALPALIANGLYHELGEYLQSPRGFYGLPQLVLLLALLTVARVLSLEPVRPSPPGPMTTAHRSRLGSPGSRA